MVRDHTVRLLSVSSSVLFCFILLLLYSQYMIYNIFSSGGFQIQNTKSVQQCNIQTSIGWIDMQFSTDTHDSQRMNLNNLNDFLVSPTGQSVHLSKILAHNRNSSN